MSYNKINWVNGSAGNTPLSAENLNTMDNGIASAHNKIDEIVEDVDALEEDVEKLNTHPKEFEVNATKNSTYGFIEITTSAITSGDDVANGDVILAKFSADCVLKTTNDYLIKINTYMVTGSIKTSNTITIKSGDVIKLELLNVSASGDRATCDFICLNEKEGTLNSDLTSVKSRVTALESKPTIHTVNASASGGSLILASELTLAKGDIVVVTATEDIDLSTVAGAIVIMNGANIFVIFASDNLVMKKGSKLYLELISNNSFMPINYYDGQLGSVRHDLDRTERSLDYLWKKSKGIIYDTETVDSTTHDVTVPSGAMEYASIDVIGGMSRKGKNVFTFDDYSQWGVTNCTIEEVTNGIKVTGTGTSPRIGYYSISNLVKGKTYTLSLDCEKTTSSGKRSLLFLNNAKAFNYNYGYIDLGSTTHAKQRYSITFTTINDYFNIGIVATDGSEYSGDVITITNIQIEESSIATDYEPYTSSLIDAKVDKVVSSNKNIFDEIIEKGNIDSSGNPIEYDDRCRSKNFIKVKKNTDYYIRQYNQSGTPWLAVYLYDDNYNFIKVGVSSSVGSKTFNTENATYIKWKSNTSISTIGWVQIEEGTSFTGYVPYFNSEKTIPQSIISLCTDYGIGINDSCYNYIDFDSKTYHHKVSSRAYVSGDEDNTSYLTNGTITYYPIAEELIDLSSVWTEDLDILQVDAGGKVQFHYDGIDTYNVGVPSKVTYMIDVSEV